MIGGSMKMTSRFAMVAAAGVLLGAAVTSAKAADLGGGCCADLEERVAELEATTARKGNRVVSLQVYGQVNKALLFFDDGVDSDAYIVDNDYSGSRVGFVGSAALKPGWKAGFLVELDIQDASSNLVDNGGAAAAVFDDPADEIVIRYSNVYVESEKFGRITLGQGSTAGDGAYEVVLGNSLRNSDLHVGNGFFLRDGVADATPGFSNIKLSGLASNFDAGRDDVIRYDSPSIYGFILSASWGDDDYADVALRFKKEWNSVRIAAAVSYQWDDSRDGQNNANPNSPVPLDPNNIANAEFETIGGSISVMHIPTGIYGALAGAEKELQSGVSAGESASYWYAQLGIEKKFLSYGSTTVYAEYGLYDDVLTITNVTGVSSEAERWGFGVVQKFDSAALELYAQATFWSFEASTLAGETVQDQDLEDLSTIMIGSRIKF